MKNLCKTLSVLLVALLFVSHVNAQSLGIDRVAHIKNSTVKIIVGGKVSGTGFLASEQGLIMTCFHVIESAYQSSLKLEVEFSNGKRIEVGLLTYILNNLLRDAAGYDCALLVPLTKTLEKYEFLNIGSYSDIQEGDEVMTIGYPLGISQPIVSKGYLSTKWTEKSYFTFKGKLDSLNRQVSWLDMTMNRGNSGGAIIKLGQTSAEDKVIGIATFILNPYGPIAAKLATAVRNTGVDVEFGGISQMQTTGLFAEAISNNSIGVSGCISIDHVVALAKQIK